MMKARNRFGLWGSRLCAIGLAGLGTVAGAQPAPSLTVVSWNLEWLADTTALRQSGYWARCKKAGFANVTVVPGLPPCKAVGTHGRDEVTYRQRKLDPLKARLTQLAAQGMDVLAVQEVGTPAALEAVLPEGWRVACFTETPQAQNIGYAVRAGSGQAWTCRSIDALSLPPPGQPLGRYRPGLEIATTLGGNPGTTVSILNLHLKASCASTDMSRRDHGFADDCATLQRQVPLLEAWIERQAEAGGAFVVLGDFNRDLEREWSSQLPARTGHSDPASKPIARRIRHLWPEVNDGVPEASRMALANVDRQEGAASGCHTRLDQAVVSQRLMALWAPTAAGDQRPPARLLAAPPVSDHCPLWLRLGP